MVIKSVDFLVRLPGRLKAWAKAVCEEIYFFRSDIAACVLLTQFIWLCSFFICCGCEILVTKKTIIFYGHCGFEGAILFDFSHSDRYFLHAIPGCKEYRTFKVTRSARTHVLESNEQHQNGWSTTSTYVEIALGSLSFIHLLMLLASYCFHFYVEWMTFNPKGPLLIGS